MVVVGKTYLASWYCNSPFLPEWIVDLLETGWTNNCIGVDWIKYFDKYSRPYTIGGKRLLVLDGYKSHHLAEFENYYKENNIVTLYMPSYSSYLLQPLDVGCFSVLKQLYSKEIEKLIRNHIHYITKPDFFLAFYVAFWAIFRLENV